MIKLLDFFGGGYLRAGLALAVVVAIALMGWRVSTWRHSHHQLQATEKALETTAASLSRCTADADAATLAYSQAAGKAASQAAADRATAQRIEDELQARLSDADARGRDLARRLLDATRAASACRGAVSGAATAAAEPARAAGEPGSDAALGEVFAACTRDAERLRGWQQWWSEVSGRE